MKKVILFSLCLVALGASMTSSFANTSSSFKGDKRKMEITLTLDNVKEGQQLRIKDLHGIILYAKTIEKDGIYNNKFDLTALPDGTYFFEHEKGFQTNVIPFTVKQSTVTFNKEKETTLYSPVVRIKNNNIYVSKLNLNKEKIDVHIYYSNDQKSDSELLHHEIISDSMNVNRVYNLSKKLPGEYKMVINANGREYVEYFEL